MRNKKGQFYLVAAIIIVLVLAGIASIRSYAIVRPEPRTIQDLGSELKEETSRIVDYGIYNTGQNLNQILNNFTDTQFAPYFLQKTGKNTGIVFLYGNQSGLQAVQYSPATTGVISATIGTVKATWVPTTSFAERAIITPTDPLRVNLSGKEFKFNLQDNEMFYFVIVQEEGNETYVERN